MKNLKFENEESIFNQEEIENPFRTIKKEIADLEISLIELGLWSFHQEFASFKKNISCLMEKIILEAQKIDARKVKQIIDLFIDNIENLLKELIPNFNQIDNLLDFVSEKVNALVSVFQKSNLYFENLGNEKFFHSIVFAERKKTVRGLYEILFELSKREEYKFIRVDYIYGSSLNGGNEMSPKKQVHINFY